MHATPTQAVPLHTSCALTEDEIDAAIRRADIHNLFGMKARRPARPKPPLRPSGDFYTLVAVSFLLAATYATIWRCTATYATIACDPRIEVCK
jgi:hypothetical protein